MTLQGICKMFVISLWLHFDLMPMIHCNTGIDHVISKQDALLINDTENPKCFTRTNEDFTCFFETAENRTYVFFYSNEGYEGGTTKKCNMYIHGTQNGTSMHVCLFPWPDVILFSETKVKVVDPTKNTTLYSRTVFVEELCLLNPPFNLSLQPNGNVGKLIVFLETENVYLTGKIFRIYCSSWKPTEKTLQMQGNSYLLSLEPGEEVEVKASVKCFSTNPRTHPGYWSAWSKPARATVPQTADDISLKCFTSDLHNLTCVWNSSKYNAENDYKLYYKMSLGCDGLKTDPYKECLSWTEWIQCQDDVNLTDTCSFPGDNLEKIKVKLSSPAAVMKPLFFSKEFLLNESIKTAPPRNLQGKVTKEKLCFDWEAPLSFLSSHLQYEVDIQIKGEKESQKLKPGSTSPCVQLPTDSQFSVKIRAKPDGSFYSGYWSEWSEVFLGATTTNTDMWLTWLTFVFMLIIAVSFIPTFFFYRRKFKQYFWPPVPNLDKVLLSFLTDINQQQWDRSVTSKMSFEETISSVVEIMSVDEILTKPSEESSDLLSSDGSFSIEDQVDGSPGNEVLSDCVTLNKDLSILCLKENCYVYEQFREEENPKKIDEILRTCCGLKPCSCNNYFNRSYLPGARSTDSLKHKINDENGESNPYTNLALG